MRAPMAGLHKEARKRGRGSEGRFRTSCASIRWTCFLQGVGVVCWVVRVKDSWVMTMWARFS